MAIFKNAEGKTLDTSKYTNLQGNEAVNWAKSQDMFKGYTPETVQAPVNNSVIKASEITNVNPGVVNESAKMGTFVTYDPLTGKASNRRALEVGTHGQNDYLENPINGVDYAQNPDQYVITSKNANTLYGFKKPKVEKPADTPTAGNPGASSTGNPILDKLNDMFSSNQSEIDRMTSDLSGTRNDVAEKSEYVNTLKGELDSFKNEIDYNKVLQTTNIAKTKSDYYDQKEIIEGKPITAAYANRQLAKLTEATNIALDKESIAQAVADATNTYKYNSKLIEYNIALGDLQNAQSIAKETAQDIKEYKSQMLTMMQMQNQIDYQTKQLKQDEINREYDMALKGYTYVENLSALNDLAVKKGTDWVEQNTTKIGGKIYIKPEDKNVGNWSVETDPSGNQFLLDQKTGQTKSLGVAGDIGGQCGEYINNIMGTSFGDSWENKQSKTNVSTQDFQSNPQVGDVLVFKTKLPYGHVAAVTAVNGDQITVTESNWKGDEKIGTRTIAKNDMSISGVYRGASFKEQNIDPYKRAFDFLTTGYTADQRKAAQASFNQIVKTGDKQQLTDFIVKQAIDTAPTEQQNKAFGRAEALSALNDIEDYIETYKLAGGDTGIFTGNIEKISQKIGETSDPALANIQNSIKMAIIDYRKAVSGAAFTEAEAAEYDRIFPSIMKSDTLNQANIKSLRSTFERNQKSFLTQMIGSVNYDNIFGGTVLDSSLSSLSNDDFFSNFGFVSDNQAAVSPERQNVDIGDNEAFFNEMGLKYNLNSSDIFK